jgi:single-stranded DNA-binding protein
MTIHVHLSGQLAGDPARRVGQKGAFATASVRSGSGDDAIFINVIAFSANAERLLELRKGDAISVAGRGELRSWVNHDGIQKTGLSVVAAEIAAARPRPRARDATPQRARPSLAPPPDDAIDDLYPEPPR